MRMIVLVCVVCVEDRALRDEATFLYLLQTMIMMKKRGNEKEEEEECRGDWQVFWCRGRVTYCWPEISNDGEQIPSKW